MSSFLVRKQVAGFVALLVRPWWVMTWTDEAGHVVAGWCAVRNWSLQKYGGGVCPAVFIG